MKISLLMSTYNWKDALDLCLKSILGQTRLPDEIIIADDGSREDTAELIRDYTAKSPIPLIHLWHPDEGFRKSIILNQGIVAAQGDYIVQLDGDTIINRFFVEDHFRIAKPGTFVQGKRANLSPEATRRVLDSGVIRIWPFTPGIAKWWHRRYLLHSHILSAIFSKTDRQMRGILGCNMAYWRSDALRINGYDEKFVGYGYEDTDFAQRLLHLGLRRQHVRHLICGAHLYHPCRAGAAELINEGFFQRSRDSGIIRCKQGIDCHSSNPAGGNVYSTSPKSERIAAS